MICLMAVGRFVDAVALPDRNVRRHVPRELLEDAEHGLDAVLGAGFVVRFASLMVVNAIRYAALFDLVDRSGKLAAFIAPCVFMVR